VLQRREIPGPVVVARGVEAEINRVRAGADPCREHRIGGVAGDYLRAVDGTAAGTVHRGHVGAQADVPLGHQAADLSGTEDDVTAHDCSLSLALSRTGRITVRAVTTTAPLLPNTVNWSLTAMPAA
jgi:hypothetical protein